MTVCTEPATIGLVPKQEPTSAALEQISQRRAKTLTSIVREAIEDMIMSGELAAGDRVNESLLAARLSVSRGPIREACRSLEQAGLLVSAVNQGFFVREMTLDEARDLYEVRGALSGLIGRLIAERAADGKIADLTELVNRMDVAAGQQDVSAYFRLNLAFHEARVEAAANPALKRRYNSIVSQLHLYRRRGLVQKGSLSVSNQEHRAIVDALAARDGTAAEQAMRRHVAGGWSRISASV